MGTYVDALFGHDGDPEHVLEILRSLAAEEGFRPLADVLGRPELTRQDLDKRWQYPTIVHRDLLLESDEFLLRIYPRGASLYHANVRWGAFASNGVMNDGLGREHVRSRSREIAGRFGAARVLYVPSSIGVNRLCEGVGIEEEEAWLLKGGPPLAFEDRPENPDIYMQGWFREPLR